MAKKLTAAIPNLYVPIVMHGKETGKVLKTGESIVVTDTVWDQQVIAQQQARDGRIVVTNV